MCTGSFTTNCWHKLLEPPVHSAFPCESLPGTDFFSSLAPLLGQSNTWHHCLLTALHPGGSKSRSETENGNPSKQHSKTFVLIWTILCGCLRIYNYSVPIFLYRKKSVKTIWKGRHHFWKHFFEGKLITSLSLNLILRCLKERNKNKIQKHICCFYLCWFHRNNAFKLKGMKGCGNYWKVMNQFQSILIPV